MCDNNINPTQDRKRRDIEGSDELTHEDFEVLMTPLKSNEHHREKRSVVSKDNATRYCAERLLETRVGKLCAKLGTNVQALVNVCSADIEYTGDFSFAIGAVSMLMNECEDVVIENMTVNSNETKLNNVMKLTITSALEKVLQLLCPNDCTFNGKCVNGSCVCNKDYTAADCSISIYQRPTITRIQSNGLCDRRKRPCEKTTVQGRDFLNSTNITCHIREIEVVNSSWIPNKNETKYQGTMTDLVLVECLLPSLPVLRMRYHETIKGTPAAGLMISVSNNGIDKSSQELKMISFDSVCMDCNVSAGCRLQKNACFINRYCFAPNEPNPRDWCQQCIPEVNTKSWTKRQVNHPPNVALETNYYVVYRENFKLPIEAVDPEGMPVTVSLQEGSPKKAMIRNNVLYWNVTTNQTSQFFFKATDACQASSAFNMTITVVPCPCKNSGQCVPKDPRGQGNYTCQCAPGYTGDYCGTEIDECASYPCLRGRCTDLLNNYSCSCHFGFEGRNCDHDIDYCMSSPCVNAGNCTDEVSGYTCNCLPGYSGSRCEVDINECSSSPCLNNGTCVDQVNSFKCSCSAGYMGHNCSVNIDECQSSPCVNNGSCIDGINGFGCTCKAGFAGLQCEENVDECRQVSCGNGTCFDRINNFSCVCDVGYMGRHCDVVITRCSNDSCYPGVPCIDKTVPISCGPCPSGFTGNGKNCKDIDDCDNHTCANGASCVDGINRYSCLCTTGFIGRYCEIDIDDCINNTCANGASCVDGIYSYSCNCSAGFTGTYCDKDIDECASGPCFNGGSCVDGVNGYLCNCSRGITGKRCGTNKPTTTTSTTTTVVPTTLVKNVRITEGDDFTLNCTTEINTHEWSREEGKPDISEERTLKDGESISSSATVKDSGKYLCEIDNERYIFNVSVKVLVKVEMVISVLSYTFTPELQNKSSQVYKETEKNFTAEMDKVYNNTPGYVRTEVLNFTEGSVKVDFRVIIVFVATDPKNESTIIDKKATTGQTIIKEAENGLVSRLRVKPEVTVKTPPPEPRGVGFYDVKPDQIGIQWMVPDGFKSFDILSYEVEHWIFGKMDKRRKKLPAPEAKTEYSYRIQDLEPETTYMIRVAAINVHGSNYNEEKGQKTPPAPFPYWVIALIVLFAVAAIIGAVVCIRRRMIQRRNQQHEEEALGVMESPKKFESVLNQDEKIKGLNLKFTNASYRPTDVDWTEIPFESIKIMDELGSGAFGVVYKGEICRENGDIKPCAVKALKASATDEEIRDLYNELEIMSNIGSHPNLVNLLGACTKDGNLLVVLEIAENGSLIEFLKKIRSKNENYDGEGAVVRSGLSTDMKLSIALDVAKGMAHLASHRCIHRDLAARNVLLGKNYVAKVADYGMARDVYEQLMYKKETQGKLPVKWMAIESLETYVFTVESDVWSYGVLLWEMETGGLKPYPGLTTTELMAELKKGYRLEQPNGCSNEMYQVMMDCWHSNPSLRATFDQLVERLEKMSASS